MAATRIPRPGPDEAAPFYRGYIDRVGDEHIARQLTQQLEDLEHCFGLVDEAAASFRYAPGKWSIKEILGHLSDAERVFAYRLLCIARGDTTPLPGFDENAYVPAGRFGARRVGSLLEEFRAVRLSTLALVESLPPDGWTRRGQASGKMISARALAYIIVGHVAHHLSVLAERYGIPRADQGLDRQFGA